MVGRTILHYRVVEKLGEGGMGVVYKAEDTQLRRTVALKFLPRETLDEEEVKARLLREAQAAASLDHPNICQVFGIHEEDGVDISGARQHEAAALFPLIGGDELAELAADIREQGLLNPIVLFDGKVLFGVKGSQPLKRRFGLLPTCSRRFALVGARSRYP